MARIRSVHPELFTDEGFCSLSPLARLLNIGIWTLCDDHGVFEWKPFGMKITILPIDNADIPTLLKELETNNQVTKFEEDGKTYGLVRNFCRYQRPKKPAYKHPFPATARTYVAWKGDNPPPVGKPSPTATEKPSHRRGEERREGNREGKPKTTTSKTERVSSPAPSAAPSPSAPETLSPKAKASPGKGLAALGSPLPSEWVPSEKLCDQVKTDFGMTDEDLQREVPAFHALNVSQGTYSQDWSGTFYLFCKRWAEHKAKQPAPRVELTRQAERRPEDHTEEEWDKAVAFYARTGRWMREYGPDPMHVGNCKAPRHILEKHGISEDGERRIPPRKAMSA